MMKTGEVRPDQEDLIQEQEDLQPSHVKVEQEGEQLHDLDEADIIEFTYNPRCSVRPNEDRSADGTAQVEPGSAGPDHEQLVVSSETEDSEDYSKDSAGPRSASVKLKRKRTGRARGLFSCRVCSRKFKARRLLFRHVKAHLQEAEQVCGVCGERFKTSDSLNLHIQTHRTTRNTSELENRTRTLSREKGVHQISNCNTNAKIHEDQKLNRCDDCGKTFLQVWKKKKHRCRPRNQNQDPENLERPKKMRQT
uniref:zinc finger protein 624-like n=1 Tax=Monopterus albus TaxID=43700 RepID=UPI0009B3B9F5|nr:zinc finger protein 624-like [Monopterus albus]